MFSTQRTSLTPIRAAAALACLIFLAALAGGCGAQSGTTLVKYQRGDVGDRFTEVPERGTVALYGSNDVSPNIRYPVDRGDRIGFRDERSQEGGNVIAVAADNELPVQSGAVIDRTFYWKFNRGRE